MEIFSGGDQECFTSSSLFIASTGIFLVCFDNWNLMPELVLNETFATMIVFGKAESTQTMETERFWKRKGSTYKSIFLCTFVYLLYVTPIICIVMTQ